MDMFDLASTLFGRGKPVAQGSTLTATGSAASAGGTAYLVMDADVTPAEGVGDDTDQTVIDVPTSPSVAEGDEVIMTLVGDGPLKTPVVISNPGSGDRMQAQVDSAETLAQQAEDVAQEAAAEVEQVRQDVADFRDDVATTYATKVEREDGDEAVKTFITTNYTNSNDLATTYATKTLVSQTKDAIELAASQTYETQSDAAATYATKSALTVGLDGIRSEVAEDYQPKGDYATTASMNSAIQQSASSIESSVAATYETKTDAAATYATKTEVQQTASGLDTRITTAQSTADGAYLERTATGTTIDTTGAASIRSLVVEGQSVQDGTPSPSAPVPIVSVGPTSGTSIALCCGDPDGTYTTTPIDLQGHALRSLPDGTHDEMAVDSLGRVTLTKRIESHTINASSFFNALYTVNGRKCAAAPLPGLSTATGEVLLCDRAVVKSRVAELTVGTVYKNPANILFVGDTDSTIDDLREMYGGATVIYPLATPQTIDLGTIELPAPADTLWLDAAIVPTMGATWWTVGGIAGQQALEAEVTERQTLIRQFSGGVLAGYVGNAIAALVNAAGSFDVVRTAWSGGVPSILGTLATFGANLIRIGEETGQNVLITSAGQLFRDGLNNILAIVSGTDPGVAIYDGEGNAADNIVALFSKALVRIGGRLLGTGTSTASVQFFQSDASQTDVTATHVVGSTTPPTGPDDVYGIEHNVRITTTTDGSELPQLAGVSGWAQLDMSAEVNPDYRAGSASLCARVGDDDEFGDGTPQLGVLRQVAANGIETAEIYMAAPTLALHDNAQYKMGRIPMEQAIAALTTPITSRSDNISSMSASTDARGGALTLAAGTYLIDIDATIATSSGSGTRSLTVGIYKGGSVASYRTFGESDRAYKRIGITEVMQLTAQTSIQAYIQSSVAVSSASSIRTRAVRLS